MLLEFGNQKKAIGETIKVARLARGFGQADLAKMVGITQGYLSKLEAGKIAPSAIDWFNISTTLQFSADSLRWGYPEFSGPLDSVSELAHRVKFPQQFIDQQSQVSMRFFYPIIGHLESACDKRAFQKKLHRFFESTNITTACFRLPVLAVNEEFISTFFEHIFHSKDIEKVLIHEVAPSSVNVISWSKDFLILPEIQSPAIKIETLLNRLSNELAGLEWSLKRDNSQNVSQIDLRFKSSFKDLKIKELMLPYTANRLLPMIHQSMGDKKAKISQLSKNECRIVWT